MKKWFFVMVFSIMILVWNAPQESYSQYMGNVGSGNETGSYTLEEALEIQKRRNSIGNETNSDPKIPTLYPRELTADDAKCMKKTADVIITGKIPSPKLQVFCGNLPDDVICGDNLHLIFKSIGNVPVCVTEKTAQILLERGWQQTVSYCEGVAKCIKGKVTGIIDGDTIKVDDKSIRFALTSAPELSEFEGVQARQFIHDLCPTGSTVIVDEDDEQTQGSYGRTIGVIYCHGKNLNSELLDVGWGYMSTEFCDSSEFSETDWAQKFGC